ncbi:MAG TPA: GxxExxY protein [Candidatus Magasanikbacteria bacterium]|nr:GxxExxY protein [Candidatus Magasanikbacteria bacterium]
MYRTQIKQIGQINTNYNPPEIDASIRKILRAYYNVYNDLGYGFLEKVYERSLIIELQKLGLHGRAQVKIKVYYDGVEVGDYYADIIVENKIILEIKAAESLCEEHEAQLLNYLKATDIEHGILLNFGKKPEFRKKIYSNEYLSKFV